MDKKIFVPKRIKVGYQNRNDTYTGKLAYVIYYDHTGKLRKETSWQSWRKDSIPENDYDNVPTEGFVLNKKAGGYSTGWNHRQTYCRVYDTRGFEFEITILSSDFDYFPDDLLSTDGQIKGVEIVSFQQERLVPRLGFDPNEPMSTDPASASINYNIA